MTRWNALTVLWRSDSMCLRQISVYRCHDCGGALWEAPEPEVLHFRCHVGHRYAPEVLLMSQSEEIENAMWEAVRALVERITLTRQSAPSIAPAVIAGPMTRFARKSFHTASTPCRHRRRPRAAAEFRLGADVGSAGGVLRVEEPNPPRLSGRTACEPSAATVPATLPIAPNRVRRTAASLRRS